MQWEEFLSEVKQVNPAVTSELLRNVVYYLTETREVFSMNVIVVDIEQT